MKNRLFQRIAMLIAGLLAAVVILLSQSFYKGTVQATAFKKVKTEQSTEKESHSFISAPSDLLPGASTTQVVENPPVLLSILEPLKIETTFAPIRTKVVTSFFKTLFRTVIASQAP